MQCASALHAIPEGFDLLEEAQTSRGCSLLKAFRTLSTALFASTSGSLVSQPPVR